jgi:hypothetical protein
MKRTFTKKSLAVVSFTIAMFISLSGSAQIYWNFGVTAALSAYPTSGIPANITVDSVRPGNSTGTPFLATTSASSGYINVSGGGNAGITAKVGSLDYTVNATTGSAFYEITLTPAAGYYVDVTGISFGSRSTATGPKKYSIRTNLDSYATEVAGDTITSTVSTWGLRTETLTITGAEATPVKIRIYGYAGTGAVSAINFRLDDLTIDATAVAAGAVITMDPADTASCEGTAVSFTAAASNATTFEWQEDAGSGFVTLASGGVYADVDQATLLISDNTGLDGYLYRVIAINASGNDTSAVAALTVNPTVLPSLSIASTATTLCEFDSISGYTLPVNGGSNPSYIWFVAGIGPVGTDSALFIPAGLITAGSYTVTAQLTSDAACASQTTVSSNPLVITVNAAPSIPVISLNADTLSTTSYTTYQWYYSGTTALGTDSSQVATLDGDYSVVVTNSDGCFATSDPFSYTAVGISSSSFASEVTSITPNPSSNGIFYLNTGNISKTTITVYNILGKKIVIKQIPEGRTIIDLSAQANGSYFVNIKTDKEMITKKIIISK